MRLVCGILCALLSVTTTVFAHGDQQQILDAVDFDQRIGHKLPENLRFLDARGKPVQPAVLANDQPLLLVMSWFDCPNLCPMLLDQLAAATRSLPFPAEAYRVAVVSIAPEEGPAAARRLRRRLSQVHADGISNWHFLTGKKAAIDALAQTVGFEYVYDSERDRYAHPAGITVISPGGQISRYLFGMNPDSQDLKLALLEAGRGELGDPVDHVLLRCYRFNPRTGQYDLAVMNLLRVAGGGSVLLLGGLLFWLRRRERQ